VLRVQPPLHRQTKRLREWFARAFEARERDRELAHRRRHN
jgi:hypothetical protein